MKKKIRKIIDYCARFLQIQLFLTTVSLPILISWGLPLSAMTAVGNFIFNPFLALFLGIASFIFFTELLGINNSWLIIALSKLTDFWCYCLSFGSKSWLVGFCSISPLFLILIAVSAFLIMHHKVWGQLYHSIIALFLLLFISFTVLYLHKKPYQLFSLNCGRNSITVRVKDTIVSLQDNGAFAKKLSPDNWIQYTLLPELYKKTGTNTLKTVTISHINTLSLEAITSLCEHAQIEIIEMPYFNESLTKAGWKQFFKLKKTAESQKTTLKRTPEVPAITRRNHTFKQSYPLAYLL